MEKEITNTILSELRTIKEDLENMASKKDLDSSILSLKADMLIMRQNMATKHDILEIKNEMATKNDIYDMATKTEIKNISKKIDNLMATNNEQHKKIIDIAQEMSQTVFDESKKDYEELKSNFFKNFVG